MSKLTATLFAAFLFVSCSNNGAPDLLPCEGLGYYDPETHYCHQELRPRCEDENNCASAGDESCSITSAAQNGHTYEIRCEGRHIGYLDNGTSGGKGDPGFEGTDGKGCSIDSTESGVKITCKTITLPLSHGTVGIDGKDGENGKDGQDGKPGENGIDGESCTIAAEKTGIGVEITCDKVELLTHGTNGTNGIDGTKGDDCTITETSTGVEIKCGTVPLYLDSGKDGDKGEKGDNGDAGKGCTIAPTDDGWEITCDKVVSLKDGKDGKPASVITTGNGHWYINGEDTGVKITGDNGDNCTVVDKGDRFEMTCGTKTVAWPKAMCMAIPYDPAKEFCDSRDYNIYELCGSEAYDNETQFCDNGEIYDKCGGKVYDPATYVCHYDKIKYFFTDVRNGKKYASVTIGTQTWMAENLNLEEGGRCYDDDESNCETYSRLYDWATAMGIPSVYNSSSFNPNASTKYKGICPDGWHLPSDEEWNVLVAFVHNNNDLVPYTSGNSDFAGKYLKAETYWNGTIVNDDKYGFSALPGGYGDGSNFNNLGNGISWWSTSENGDNYAYDRNMYYTTEFVNKSSNVKSRLYSVRCMRDD